MSLPSIPRYQNPLIRHLSKLRLGIVLLSLALILYIAYLLYSHPYPSKQFVLSWAPDNVLTVLEVNDPGLDMHVGDVIVAINGALARQGILQIPAYGDGTTAVYRLARGNEINIAYEEATTSDIIQRLIFGIVALITWGVSAPIILFATPSNKDAWLSGLVFIGLSLSLLALSGFNENVPGTVQVFWILTPISALGFIRLGFSARFGLTDRISPLLSHLLHLLYILGGGIFILAIIEVVFLFPAGSSIELVLGFSLIDYIVKFLAFCLVLNPITLLLRYHTLPTDYQQQQVRLLMLFTLFAIVPSAIDVIIGYAIIPIIPTIAMIALIPASYGYVIYRKDFLLLDVFVSKTVIWLFAGTLLIVIYLGLMWAVRMSLKVDHVSAAMSVIPMLGAIIIVFSLLRPLRHLVISLIFDSQQSYQYFLNQFTANLADSPQKETLIEVIHQMIEQVSIRQAAYLLQQDGQMHLAHSVQTDPIQPLPTSLFNFPKPYLVHAQVNSPPLPIRDALPDWVALVMPLISRGELVGALFLGRPMPNYYFTGQQYEFLKRAANIIAISSETINLFESSLSMSLEIQQVRDKERARVASQIHDDPLQQITFITTALNKAIVEMDAQQLPQFANQIRENSINLQIVSKKLREICTGLNPPVLQQGVEWVVREVVYSFQQKGLVDIHLQIRVSPELCLSDEQTAALYHILVESLNNVCKHAEATTVQVSLIHDAENLQLTVEDDGKGCNLESDILASLVRNNHFGLAGMHTWARNIGAKLTIKHKPVINTGTIVQFTIPAPLTREI